MAGRANILIILAGGMRGDALGAAGVWPIDTPHLNAIASGGLALTAISPSPARVPALVSLYAGLHPRQHGVLDDHNEPPRVGGWVRAIRDAGYYLAGVGRVGPVADLLDECRIVAEPHVLDPHACEYLRFAISARVYERVEHQRKTAARTGVFETGEALDEPAKDVDGFISTVATAMIDRLPRERPWCLIVAYTGPGNRLPAPPMYLDCVPAGPLAQGFLPAPVGELDGYGTFAFPRTMLQRLGPRQAAAIRRHYLARTCLIDCGVGMLRDAIDRNGHTRTTWTVLSSDRGELLGERGMFAATSFVGAATYVPLWIRPPTHNDVFEQANDESIRAADGLISSTALATTLCEIARTDAPSGCAAPSVLGALGGGQLGSDMVISEFDGRLMAETLQYKAIYDVPTGELRVLFNMVDDPDERRDLVDTREAIDVEDMLALRLARHLMRMPPVRAATV